MTIIIVRQKKEKMQIDMEMQRLKEVDMMLKSEKIEFERLSGENAEITSISRIGGYLDGYNKALENRKWVPCEKKMPKAEEKVWIQTQSGKVCFAMYEDGTISENDSNWSWFDIEYSSWNEDEDCGIIPEGWWEFTQFHPDCEFDCPVDEKVVAWMPLPEPYKGE